MRQKTQDMRNIIQSACVLILNRGLPMKKVEDYLDHAAECRALARATSLGEQRRQLEEMARTWEQLADARRRELNKPSA